ncbi:hypothetical protein B0H16DRAFT_1714591 [Mycena metata]|uniref:Uncharacterized protein n=1 Tax=Mycena metata TaxID=1033252 RepID=A0AAD7JV36_9AGAR|nr:hypothetical protein B0H16DRAFT_1714591 [Mycena metata]
MPTKSVCGRDFPLTNTFDFAAWRKQPTDIAPPADMELQERNQHNHDAQMANRASIILTRAYEQAVYGDAKIEKMVTSPDYCTLVVAPIPPKMMEFLLEEREKRAKAADKKKEEEKAAKEKGPELQGSMIMESVTKINILTCPPVKTPDFLLAAIRYRMHPPLFWFTDTRLRYAVKHTAELPMKKNTSIIAAPEKSLLDVVKLKTLWGSDDSMDGVTLLTWSNTFTNFLAAVAVLSPPPSATNPFSLGAKTQAHESHPVEKRLRNKILDNNLAFDAAYWVSKVGGILNAWKAAKTVAGGTFGALQTPAGVPFPENVMAIKHRIKTRDDSITIEPYHCFNL